METEFIEKMEKPIKTRLVKESDLEELKEIWKLSFGDDDSFIDLYFQSIDWIKQTAVLLCDGRVVSMLTMIPVDMAGENGEKRRASMLFAIATHPDFQKRGFAERLIEFSNQYLLSMQTAATLLVPAKKELFRFYKKRGYQDGFFVREAVLHLDEIEKLAGPCSLPGRVTPIEPAEYNRLRRKRLKGHNYLDYRDEEIFFQKRLSRMFDADLYAIMLDGAEGCAYAERISQEEVIVKELLVPEKYLAFAMKKISELIPGEKYIVRTPPCFGEILGGTVRPFGMLRVNKGDGKLFNSDPGYAEFNSYLGIAHD